MIRLKFQNELSYKEISQVTGLSVTNVGFLHPCRSEERFGRQCSRSRMRIQRF